MNISHDDFLTLIPKKEKGFITGKRLSKMTGYSEPYIRSIINQLRAKGNPICSTKQGYFLSDEYADIDNTVKFLTHRINTQLQAINGLNEHIKYKEN